MALSLGHRKMHDRKLGWRGGGGGWGACGINLWVGYNFQALLILGV